MMYGVVAPFDQTYDVLADAMSVTELPAQNVVGPFGVMTGLTGFALTVTAVDDEVAEQPLAFVTATLKLPVALTVIDCVVAPFDHKYDEPAEAVSVTELPAQNVVGPEGVIVAIGLLFTVTAVDAEVAEQPLAFVTATLKLPVALTVIDCVVAPFDHKYDEPAEAVSVTEPPAQNVVGPEAVIVAIGFSLTVTATGVEVALVQPLPFVTVTL